MRHQLKTGTLFERGKRIPAMSMVKHSGSVQLAIQALLFQAKDNQIQNSKNINT